MNSLNIFVVEDDIDLAEGLADTLELEGHQVEVAHSGEEAIARFKEKDFDLTFMDVKLPGKNGVESFLEIRAFRPEARVMMMTGYSTLSLLDEAMDNGVLGVLKKPFDIEIAINLASSVGSGSRVLIVEDDVDYGRLVKGMLEKNGHWVKHSTNGFDAIDICRDGDIDVVFLDLRLGGATGLEVLKDIRSVDKNLPVVLVTAYADEEYKAIDEMKSMALADVISKPAPPELLLDCISRLK